MEEMLNIVQTDNSSGQLSQLYAQLSEHQSFRSAKQPADLDAIVAHISNLLNDVATKHTGLMLLHHFLPQAPIETLELKGAHWTTQTIKVSIQRTNTTPTTGRLAIRVLQQLVHRSAEAADLGKAMSQTLLTRIMEALPQLPASSWLAALQLLQAALRLYPGAACIGRASAIEKWACGFADAADARLVRAAAICLHLLQQTRGGGTAGSGHKQTWSAYQLALLAQLHQLLDAVYANTPEVMDAFVAGGDERLVLPELQLSDEPVPRYGQLVTRFRNVCEFLRVTLVAPYPVPKAVQPAKILSLISRGLAVNCATLAGNLIIDNIVVGALIPRIHGALFGVLDALISVLRTNLLPHGHNIMQLVMQSLQWTSSGRSAGRPRPFRQLRCAAYRTLLLWTRVAGAASGAERHDELIEQIVQDVTPYATEVRLKVLSGARRHMSKKARKQLHRAQNDATNLAQSHGGDSRQVQSDAGNEQLCEAALLALGGLLAVCGQFLKPVVQRLLHEHIVRLAVTVRLQSTGTGTTGNLYSVRDCRLALYAALEALVLGAHHLVPAPLQYARVIFAQAAQRDGNRQVREECARAGRVLERILHPQKEPMRFPVDAALQRDALQALKQLGGRRAAGEVDSDAEVEAEGEAEAEQSDEDGAVDADDGAEVETEEMEDDRVDDEVAAEDAEVEAAVEEEEEEEVEDSVAEVEEDDQAVPVQDTEDSDNIAPRQREKRSAAPAASAAVAPAEKRPKVLSVAAMAENAAAEAMVDDMMAEFVGEFVE